MRTTNKCFKEQVQKHIMESIDEGLSVQEVANNFEREFWSHERQWNINKQEYFKRWLTGLPSSLSIEYTYSGIHETMKKWFENCGETYTKDEPDEKEFELYLNLVTREFRTLCKKEGIDF